jgi:hypothetical protein
MDILDCWHQQLRLVAKYYPDARIRATRTGQEIRYGNIFVHVSASVDRRETRCPLSIIEKYKTQGYTIIHIQEPRE